MAPTELFVRQATPVLETPNDSQNWNWRKIAGDEDLILESWSEGFVVGSLLLMAFITLANMRRGILLHKFILTEQLMALTHGTFCFMNFEGYGWYLSSTAALLYFSYILHNVVAWMKVKPFFHGKSTIFKPKFVKWTSKIYVYTLICTVPVVCFQISGNFRYFNGYGGWYVDVRPYEPLMRDFWWVFCCGILFYVISKSYGMGVFRIIKASPRFGILFVSIILALMFTALDIAASIHPFIGDTDGINPFWKLSLVFKCLTDAILLDDFKTELKRLGVKRMKRDEKRRHSVVLTLDDDFRRDSDEDAAMHYSNGNLNGSAMSNGYPVSPPSMSQHRYKKSDVEGDEHVDFMSALQTHPSQLSSDRESRRGSSQRPKVGQGGTPATKLPNLFAAIKPGKRRKKPVDGNRRNDSLADSIWTQQDEKRETQPQMKEKKGGESTDDDVAPDCITYEDDSLERAKMEQQRTIQELTRRKNSVAAASSTSPDNVDRLRARRKKESTGLDFWKGIDDLDDDDDDYGPSSSHHP